MVKQLTSDKARKIISVDLGSVPFETALKIQHQLMNGKKNGMKEDYLLTVEHPHTYTIGVTGSMENLLVDEEYLISNGIKLQHIRRGGDITYHGPGQLVAYPILNLNNYYKDLHRYLRDLEEVLISTVKYFGIVAGRVTGLTGIWVGAEKLASIGIKMSKWITMHGTALNVSTDLSYFDNIIPCGVRDKSVTSMSKILGMSLVVDEVSPVYVKSFSKVFGSDIVKNLRDNLLPERRPDIMREELTSSISIGI